MKQKLKILLSVYAVFQIVLACRCPDPTHYEWEIESMQCFMNIDYSDSTVHVIIESDSTSTELIGMGFLDGFGPNKAMAFTKCETERFYLKTLFEGISIKSNGAFSPLEPAGTELKDKFDFGYSCCSDSTINFEEIMNRSYNKDRSFQNLGFEGTLSQNPTSDSLHTLPLHFI